MWRPTSPACRSNAWHRVPCRSSSRASSVWRLSPCSRRCRSSSSMQCGETIEMTAGSELVKQSACAVVDLLKSEEVTPLDLLEVLEARISEVDRQVNALPTLCFDR